MLKAVAPAPATPLPLILLILSSRRLLCKNEIQKMKLHEQKGLMPKKSPTQPRSLKNDYTSHHATSKQVQMSTIQCEQNFFNPLKRSILLESPANQVTHLSSTS